MEKVSTILSVLIQLSKRKLALFYLRVSTIVSVPIQLSKRKLALFFVRASTIASVPIGLGNKAYTAFALCVNFLRLQRQYNFGNSLALAAGWNSQQANPHGFQRSAQAATKWKPKAALHSRTTAQKARKQEPNCSAWKWANIEGHERGELARFPLPIPLVIPQRVNRGPVAASGTQPGPGLVLGTPEPTHVRRPLGLPLRYTAASNSCALYFLLLRVQFGCLLQQLFLGAQIGLAHACAHSFSSSCELSLSWLSQNACKDARANKKKAKVAKHGKLHCGQRFAACPKKCANNFAKLVPLLGPDLGPVLASVLAPVLSIRIVAPKTGPKTAPKTGPKTGREIGVGRNSQQSTGLLPSVEELACMRNTMQNCGERGRLKTSCHGDTLEPSKRTCTAPAAYEIGLLYSNAERIAVVHGDVQ